MGNLIVNTKVLDQSLVELSDTKKYYNNKQTTFNGSFGGPQNLGSYLTSLRKIYKDISSNTKEVENYLKDYKEDIEGIEKRSTNGHGRITVDKVTGIIDNYKGSLNKYLIDSGKLFEVIGYKRQSAFEKIGETTTRVIAGTTMSFLALLEGGLNIFEMVGDGIYTISSSVCSLVGADSTAEYLMKEVEADSSMIIFDKAVDFLGLEQYVSKENLGTQIYHIAGNVLGMIGVALFGGAIGTASVSAEAAGGVGTLTTTASSSVTAGTVASNSVMQGLISTGSGSEYALKDGATLEEARNQGLVEGTAGLIEGAFSGMLDLFAKGAQGFGDIVKYTVAAFGLGAGEQYANELCRTAIYKHDNNITFLENFMQNSEGENILDSLLFKMGLGGTVEALGTFVSAFVGNKTNRDPNLSTNNKEKVVKSIDEAEEITLELDPIEDLNPRELALKQKEIEELLEIKELKKLYGKYLKNPNINIPEKLKQDFKKLKTLFLEVETGKGVLDVDEVKRLNNMLLEQLSLMESPSPTLKALTDVEIELKRLEYYNLLLKDPDLHAYYNSIFLLDEATASKVLKVNKLSQELKTGLGMITDEELPLLNTLLRNQVSNLKLKNELLKSVEGIDDPLLRLRKLYMELNKKVHYSLEYFKLDNKIKEKLYYAQLSFNVLNEKKKVICKGWSELYYELLLEAGFNKENVKIVSKGSGFSHKWIEVNLGNGNILIADATDGIRGSIDLAASKGGFATNGFIVLDESYSSSRLLNLYNRNILSEEFLANEKEFLLKLDIDLGYATEDGYLIDQINIAKELFSDTGLSKEVFKNQTSADIIKEITSLEIPNGMDGYEAYAYFKKILSLNLSESEFREVHFNTLFNKTDLDSIEPILKITYMENGKESYFLFSETLGKIYVDSVEKLKQLTDKLNLI